MEVPSFVARVTAKREDIAASIYASRSLHLGEILSDLERQQGVTDDFVISLLSNPVQHASVAAILDIDLSECRMLTDRAIEVIAARCSALKSLNVSRCENLIDRAIEAAAEGRSSLESLDNVSGFDYLTDRAIEAIAASCSSLTSLNVTGCENLTDWGIEAIAARCSSLKSLDVAACENLTDRAIQMVAASCILLQSLNVFGCENLTDMAIEMVASSCSSLTSLNIAGCKNLTDRAIEMVAASCSSLTSLNVAGCKSLTDRGIEAVANGCSSLNSLNAFGCENLTDRAIQMVAANCSSLTSLNVFGCKNLKDIAIEMVAASCSSLQSLNIAGCDNLTDVAVKAIAATCSSLTLLNVAGCKSLTDRGIEAVANGCSSLNSLNAIGCENLTDRAIKMVAASNSSIQSLNVAGCIYLTGMAIGMVAANCSSLESLNVAGCKNLKDRAIEMVAASCSSLQSLNVSRCESLTNNSIEGIAGSCPSLKKIEARHCTFTALPDNIGEQLPHLEVLEFESNRITALPRSIVKLQNLRTLNMRGNPLKTPPIEVANQGIDAILRYLGEVAEGAALSMLLKAVLVGDGGAGKTSLRNALACRPNPRQNPDDRTIYLDQELVDMLGLKLSLYDLGGQPRYAMVQGAFFTKSALYIIVVAADRMNKESLYAAVIRHLSSLQPLVPNAVVQLVVSKIDLLENEIDIELTCQWLYEKVTTTLERWESIANNGNRAFVPLRVEFRVLPVSVDNLVTVEEAREAIVELATSRDPPLFPNVGQTVPSTWVEVWRCLGAVAEHGDDDAALDALLAGEARILGDLGENEVSPKGAYRPRSELQALWDQYRREKVSDARSSTFDDALNLLQAQGWVLADLGQRLHATKVRHGPHQAARRPHLHSQVNQVDPDVGCHPQSRVSR